MAVKVFCNICDKKMQDIAPNKLKDLTGREICLECHQKLEKKMADLNGIAKKYTYDIEVMVKELNDAHEKSLKYMTDYIKMAGNMYRIMSSEIDAKMKDLIS